MVVGCSCHTEMSKSQRHRLVLNWKLRIQKWVSKCKDKNRADFCHIKMRVLVTWNDCIFYITSFLWPDTLYPMLIFVPEIEAFFLLKTLVGLWFFDLLLFRGFVSVGVFQLYWKVFILCFLYTSKFVSSGQYFLLLVPEHILTVLVVYFTVPYIKLAYSVFIFAFSYFGYPINILILNVFCFLVHWIYHFLLN